MRTFTFILVFAGLLVIDLRAQSVQWVKPQENFNPNIVTPLQSHNYIKSDGLDLISTACITDTITFGNQTLHGSNPQSLFVGNAGNSYLAKHSADGTLLWARHLVGAVPLDLVTDANKNIFISGYYDGPLQIGSMTLTGSGGRQNFIAKFSPQGSLRWVINLPLISPTELHDYLPLTTDGYGNVYTACKYTKIINIGSYIFNPTPNGRHDVLLVKYDPDGKLVWANSMGSPAYEFHPVLAGGLNNSVYLAYVSLTSGYQNALGPNGYFIRKFNATGIEEWSRHIPHKPIYNSLYLTRDNADNIYLSAKLESEITFGNQPVGIFNGNKEDAFVAKFSSSGTFKWADRVPGPATANFRGMDMQPGDELNFLKIDYHYTSYPYTSYSYPQSQDLILAKLDTAGTKPALFAINNLPGEYHNFFLNQTSSDNFGNLYISGFLGGTINLGSYSISAPPPNFSGFSMEPSISFIGKVQVPPLFPEITTSEKMHVFPNPAQGQVTIETTFGKGKPVTIKLANLLGQVVSEIKLPANDQIHYQMPLKDLPKGVYIIQLETEAGRETRRLVIQ